MIKRQPIALTIAGSDSGGGAGIQADLKTFAALGVHGTSAITSITAQNPKGVLGIQAITPAMVKQQIEAVFAELKPSACKTGMLFSARIIEVVAEWFGSCSVGKPLVVDPVMIATSGARLLKRSAEQALTRCLLPIATLVTPNLHEAELLAEMRIRTEEDLRLAAKTIHARFGCAALVKGGHLRGGKESLDIFFDGTTELLLAAPYISGLHLHGTGCTYSAAITAYLARGCALEKALGLAKEFITQAIVRSTRAGAHTVLNPFWGNKKG